MKTSFKEFKFYNKSLLVLIFLSTAALLFGIIGLIIRNNVESVIFYIWLLSLYINVVFYIYCNHTIKYVKDIYYLDEETEKMNRMTELRLYYKGRKQITTSLICILISMLSFSICIIEYGFISNTIIIPIIYYLITCMSNKMVLTKWVKFIKVIYKCTQVVDGEENKLYKSPNKNSNEVNDNEETI